MAIGKVNDDGAKAAARKKAVEDIKDDAMIGAVTFVAVVNGLGWLGLYITLWVLL